MKLIAPTLAFALLSSSSLVMAQSAKSPASPPQPPINTQPSSPSTSGTSSGAGSGAGSAGSTSGTLSSPGSSSSQNDTDIDRRLAQVKSALQLSDQQQTHWTAAESAMKDMLRQHEQWRMRREDFRSQSYGQGSSAQGSDRIEQMRRMGQMMSERGAAMTRLADAVKPLYDSLSEDQRRRLHGAMHDAMMQEHGRMGSMSPYQGDRGYGGRGMNPGNRSYNDNDDHDND